MPRHISNTGNDLRIGRRLDSGTANAKMVMETKLMVKLRAKKLIESIPVLILLGLLAGAIGGLGIGAMQLRSASSTSAGK
jgi:hypothetical protein